MYQSTFGITGPPFQLVADPSFYFDSSSHREVFTELSGWLFGEQGFVVVTGDTGVGKTTLVRTLVRDLDPALVAVAHLVSTQLEGDDLLMAASIGFGMVGIGGGASRPKDLAEDLSGFLLDRTRQERRAVLIIDEAQSLPRAALERLVELMTKAPRLNFQVWLVGQPELRAALGAADSQLLRECLRGSCHLGPLTRAETGAYIEHRLGKVGWNGSPRFEPSAFDEVFRWTRGVPRRINQLCNRLLMAKSLDPELIIDAAGVDRVASELSAEIGLDRHLERDASVTSCELRGIPPRRATASHGPHVAHGSTGTGVALPDGVRVRVGGTASSAPVLCVASGYGDHVKAAALIRALAARAASGHPETQPATLLRVHDNDSLAYCGRLYADWVGKLSKFELNVPEGPHETIVIELMTSFAAAIDALRPCAVVVFDGTATAFACGTVARGRRVPVVHVGAGLRLDDRFIPWAATRVLTDHLADLLFTTDAQASQTLGGEGTPLERVHCVGSLAMDTVKLAMSVCPMSKPYFDGRHGYALAVLSHPVNIETRERLSQLTEILAEVSRVIPIVWPMRSRVHAQLKKFHLGVGMPKDRVRRLPAQPYVEYIALLRRATCVLTDSWSVQEEASALNIPCLTMGVFPKREIAGGSNVMVGLSRTRAASAVWEYVLSGTPHDSVPPLWDGRAGARIASYLAAWIPATAAVE